MSLTLTLLADDYCVAQYPPGSVIPPPLRATLWAVTRATDEVSLVCCIADAPAGAQQLELGWRAFRFEGPFDFALTGILASVAVPLAQANIGIFALSTFNTDYVLVKAEHLDTAMLVLRAAGHSIAVAG